ncbi:MAG TPA: transglutaminaseTgpA domain-containing protein [Thermoanaerobaculia bacterium]|nr:transglutaminaseTgpA domain-containing protein [Thermoanaerobaculia bacterium]
MTPRAREIETLLLTMFAAVPLYFTAAIAKLPIVVFHIAMAAIVVRVAMGKSPELLPARLMRWLAVAYVPLYFVDWRLTSGTAIAASTHLVLFIAVYQPIEAMQRKNHGQRMLTAALIFVASLATSTHITVLPFVLMFAFVMFRQLMYASHLETVRSVDREYAEAPSGRAAGFYLAGSMLIGALLFPLLPRVRSPFMSGFAGSLAGSSTSLTESIDFSEARRASNDATVVARVWMNPATEVMFTPVRLRAMVYDRVDRGAWRQTRRGLREVPARNGMQTLGQPSGATGEMLVQHKPQRGKLFMPVGAYAMTGLPARLYEGPTRDTYMTYYDQSMNLRVRVSEDTEPLRLTRVAPANYPVTPQVQALARSIVGAETRPGRQAALIERYMTTNFRYVQNAGDPGAPIPIEDFLLRTRAGQCEYFAAGMVVLMTSLDVPARIAGGFYGGRRNPLTGYYALRREDAHAWTEVWDGSRWVTFDATPPALRPGSGAVNPIREYAVALADSMTFAWDRYVLTYGLGDQAALVETAIESVRNTMRSMRARFHATKDALLSPGFLRIVALFVTIVLGIALLKRRRTPLFQLLSSHLARYGIEVGPAMTMEDALRQLRAQHPDAARALEPLIGMYEEERFSTHADRSRVAKIRRKLAELRT